RAFFDLRGVTVLASSGAGAFGLLQERPAPGTRQRQAASLLAHLAVIGGLLLLGGAVAKHPSNGPKPGHSPLLFPSLGKYFAENKPGGTGKGSNNDLLPPTKGDWAQRSRMVLIRPHLPSEQTPALPVEPTIYDASASMPTQHVPSLG